MVSAQPAVTLDVVGAVELALTRRCEQAIRSHDPGISCATHVLDLEVEEG